MYTQVSSSYYEFFRKKVEGLEPHECRNGQFWPFLESTWHQFFEYVLENLSRLKQESSKPYDYLRCHINNNYTDQIFTFVQRELL